MTQLELETKEAESVPKEEEKGDQGEEEDQPEHVYLAKAIM